MPSSGAIPIRSSSIPVANPGTEDVFPEAQRQPTSSQRLPQLQITDDVPSFGGGLDSLAALEARVRALEQIVARLVSGQE
jgi:hypothetical protein